MARQNVPVPAEIARQAAFGAQEKVVDQREKGLKHNAQDIQEAASEALDAAAGYDGEFVSISEENLRTLSAFTSDRRARSVVSQYLDQYNCW